MESCRPRQGGGSAVSPDILDQYVMLTSRLLRVVLSVQQQLSSSRCFARATGICSPSARMVFLWQLQSFSFPSRSSCASHSSEYLLFVLVLFCSLLCSAFFFFSSWSGLFRCVIVPGTLALHLLYLDELRPFGLLCFTVCDRVIISCISLG